MKGKDSFGVWLRQRRKALDLTQFDLADQVGCSIVTIRKIETDERRPSKQIVERLADVLAISLEERAEFVAYARHTEDIPAAPPLRKVAVNAPQNLPLQPTSFVGRTDELALVAERLADPACRLLTLVGAGGIGKTRLALQAAAEQLPNFANGVYFVSLTGVSSPTLVASAIAGALQMSFFGADSPDVQLVNYLRHKTMLLVLDNFEHLLGATGLLTDILAAAPSVKLLTTSRERLNLQEEWVIAVEGLAFPTNLTPQPPLHFVERGSRAEHHSPLGEEPGVRAFSAVQLFVQRACQVQSTFSLEQNTEAVLTICRAVEGMPLGLELAASWLRVMTSSQIADQLEHSLDFLTTSARNAPDRHRSIRAVFDHSWKLLTPDERAIFRKLAVFRGGFEREAAKQVANATSGTLAALIDKSLLRMSPSGRYDLHELLRQYAEQQLDVSGESANTLAAHGAYYLVFLVERDADVKGRRQMAALDEIRADFDNIRAAWQWASENRQYDAISQAVNCLLSYAEMTSNIPDVFRLLEQSASAFAPIAGNHPHPVWEKIVVRREWARWRWTGPIDHELVNTILERARERNDREEIAWCLWVLYDHTSRLDDRSITLVLVEECLALRRALGDLFYIAHALMGYGPAYMNAGQIEHAIASLYECIAIRRRLGEKNGYLWGLAMLGVMLIHQIRFAEAETCFDQAIALRQEIGRTPMFVGVPFAKAALAFWRAEFEVATQFVQLGLDYAQDRDFIGVKSTTLAVLSYAVSMNGDYVRARQLCEQAKVVRWHSGYVRFMDWGLALACCGLGDDNTAQRSILDALYGSGHSPAFQLLCLPLMGILSARSGELQRAVELLGLFSTAPRELTAWADKWPLLTRLRAQLETELGAERYAAAWANGQTLSLEQIVADALKA